MLEEMAVHDLNLSLNRGLNKFNSGKANSTLGTSGEVEDYFLPLVLWLWLCCALGNGVSGKGNHLRALAVK